MKKLFLLLIAAVFLQQGRAQMSIRDESIRYQQERMVFKQWDKNKFTPTKGFLGLNPYYWMTWGLMPSYKKTDLRPLGPSGPQTQRLALVASMQATDNNYKLQADTLDYTARSEIANQSGIFSGADPLWVLYYSKELRPVLNHPDGSVLKDLSAIIRQQVINEGIYNWYNRELDMLKERLEAARTTTLDRGARIMTYHRMLLEYRQLAATWAVRTATAARNLELVSGQTKVSTGQFAIDNWTPNTDIRIARGVVQNRKY